MNRINRNINSKGKITRRIVSALFALFLAAGCLIVPDYEVLAVSLSLSVSESTVKIGDKVTVSVTVPAGVSATVNLEYPGDMLSFISASETANANSSTVIMTLGGYGGTDTATRGTIEFEATTAGTARFFVTAPVAGDQEGDLVSLDGASASVTIQNETNEEDPPSGGNPGENHGGSQGDNSGNNSGGNENNNNNGGGGETGRKSADNSLSSLKLSAGTLSPEFKYSTVNYRATVDNRVTSVAVEAKVSNDKATIVSVEGGDNLAVGENKIRIVVKAENGVTATYTVTITRKAADEGGESPGQPPQEITPPDSSDRYFDLDGVRCYPVSEFPEGVMQEGFVPSELMLWGESYPCLVDTFAAGTLHLLYMVDESGGEGRLYLLTGAEPYAVNEFVCLKSEAGYVVVLPDGNGKEPEGYAKERYEIAGRGSADVWFAEAEDKSTAVFFGVNQKGKKNWYFLDTEELTYMRYSMIPEKNIQTPSADSDEAAKKEAAEIIKLRKQNVLTIGIAAIIVIILLIVIGLFALRAPRVVQQKDDDLEFIDMKEN